MRNIKTPNSETTECQQQQVAALKTELHIRYQELAIMQRRVMEYAPAADNSAALAKYRAIEVKLEEMKKSTSWRITSPLRKVARFFRRRN